MKMLRYAIASMCLVPMIALFGCAVGSGDDEKEPVGEAESAFVSTCATDTGSPGYVNDTDSFLGCGSSETHTSGSTYGTTACLGGFRVQYHNLSTIHIAATWAGVPLTNSTSCSAALVELAVYNSAGTQVSDITTRGVWTGICFFSSNTTPAGVNSRAVARAGFCTGTGCSSFTEQPVQVQAVDPPC